MSDHSTILKVCGNKPISFNSPDTIWQVSSGAVDVFWEEKDIDGISGKRWHLFRVEKGDVCLGVTPSAGAGLQLIGVGVGESDVIKMSLGLFLEQSPDIVRSKIEKWFDRIANKAIEHTPAPRNYYLIEDKISISIDAGETIRSEEEVVWVIPLTGNVRIWNMPLRGFQTSIPISPHSWITALDDVTLKIISFNDAFSANSASTVIQNLHEVSAHIVKNFQLEQETLERKQYHLSRKKDLAGITAALGRFRNILSPRKEMPNVSALSPLLTASILVGNAAAVMVSQETPSDLEDTRLTIDDISRENGFRIRDVTLQGKWWKQDSGPLLAFRKSDESPVALIPRGQKGYFMVVPLTGRKEPVTQEVADSLLSTAHMFYRPFPDKELNWKDLMRFGFFRCKKDFYLLFVLGVLSGLLGLLMPIATGVIIGTYIPDAAKKDIFQITLILAATAISIAIFNIIKGLAMVRMEGRMDLSIQAAVWDRLLSLPVPFFKNYSSGDLAVRSLGIMAIREILSGAALNALLTLAFSSFNLAWLFYYDWQMALVAISLTSIGAIITIGAGLRTVGYQKSLFDIQGNISGMVLQFITGINKLRTTGSEGRAFRVWAEKYVEQKKLNYLSGKVDAGLSAFNGAFPVIVSVILFSWFYWLRLGAMNVADFIAFNTAYTTFQTAMLQIALVLPTTAHAIPLYHRARPILKTLPEFDKTSEKPGRLTGNIEVSHVDFRYARQGAMILRDVSISVRRGEFIAIVGGSGAGKSTLLRLLLGFENPQGGAVFYDGKDLKNLDVREVRRQMGVVLQNGQMMAGDIFRNIIGTSNLTMDDAWEAARMVGIAEDIKAMPMQMHTLVPAGGGSLSGGQRQRLLIARAISSHPRILFFDEATSALDNQTQAVVSKSLERLKVTRIVIAHRLSTIMNADRIYVMDRGRVVENGSYKELMARTGYFFDLARRQIS